MRGVVDIEGKERVEEGVERKGGERRGGVENREEKEGEGREGKGRRGGKGRLREVEREMKRHREGKGKRKAEEITTTTIRLLTTYSKWYNNVTCFGGHIVTK